MLATFQYLSGFSPFIHSDVLHSNDPMPGVMEHWEVAAKGLQYLKRKRARPGEAALRKLAKLDFTALYSFSLNLGGAVLCAAINKPWCGGFRRCDTFRGLSPSQASSVADLTAALERSEYFLPQQLLQVQAISIARHR